MITVQMAERIAREGWNIPTKKATPVYVHIALATAASKIAQDMDELGLDNMAEEYRARHAMHLDGLSVQERRAAMTELDINKYARRHATKRVRRMYGAEAATMVDYMFGFHKRHGYGSAIRSFHDELAGEHD